MSERKRIKIWVEDMTSSNPHKINEYALKVMGVDAEQMSAILSMIGGPEQSNVEWWKGVDRKSVYGYCENINDGRGVTVGVSGFVTKWGLVQKMIKEYGGAGDLDPNQCKPGKPTKCSLCDWVRARGDDDRWIEIQWKTYADNYMKLVTKYVPTKFKDNALIKGLLLDTAMNAGEFKEGNAWGIKEVAGAVKKESDPLRYVLAFLKARGDHFTSGNTEKMRKGRLGAWEKLARDGEWDMRIDPCKYAYCSGKCLGCK